METKNREWARGMFNGQGREFEAALIPGSDKILVMDWKDKNGSAAYAIRYMLDKKNGDLVITGDVGCCIASWGNPVSAENTAKYVNDIGYFISKIQCATDKFTYYSEDIKEDLEERKQAYIDKFPDTKITDLAEIKEDFNRMHKMLDEVETREGGCPDELDELFEKYFGNGWDDPYQYLGRRISKRIYLWVYGFQTGVEQLRSKGFLDKCEGGTPCGESNA